MRAWLLAAALVIAPVAARAQVWPNAPISPSTLNPPDVAMVFGARSVPVTQALSYPAYAPALVAPPSNQQWSLGYTNGVGTLFPSYSFGYPLAAQYSGEAEVNFNTDGCTTLVLTCIQGSGDGILLGLGTLNARQQALLPTALNTTAWWGTSLTSWPQGSDQGVFQWDVQFAAGTGFWEALELFDQNSTTSANKTEIDVVEFSGAALDCVDMHVHYTDQTTPYAAYSVAATGAGVTAGHWCGSADLSAGVHSYVAAWASNYVTWYLDGAQIGVTPTPAQFSGHYVQMMVNAAVSAGTISGWYPAPNSTTPTAASVKVVDMYHWSYN